MTMLATTMQTYNTYIYMGTQRCIIYNIKIYKHTLKSGKLLAPISLRIKFALTFHLVFICRKIINATLCGNRENICATYYNTYEVTIKMRFPPCYGQHYITFLSTKMSFFWPQRSLQTFPDIRQNGNVSKLQRNKVKLFP